MIPHFFYFFFFFSPHSMWGRFTSQLCFTADFQRYVISNTLITFLWRQLNFFFFVYNVVNYCRSLGNDFDSQTQNDAARLLCLCCACLRWRKKEQTAPLVVRSFCQIDGDSWAIIPLSFRQTHWASRIPRNVPVSTAQMVFFLFCFPFFLFFALLFVHRPSSAGLSFQFVFIHASAQFLWDKNNLLISLLSYSLFFLLLIPSILHYNAYTLH